MRHTQNFVLLILLASITLGCAGPSPASTVPRSTSSPIPPTGTETLVPTLTATAFPTSELSPDEWIARQNPIPGLGWSPDGKTLAVAATSGVYILDTQTRSIASLEEGEFLFPLALDPQGGRLFAGNKVWDMDSNQLLYQLPQTNISAAAFRPDGKTLATGNSAGVTLWDALTGKLQKSLDAQFGDAQWGLAYNADGDLLYAVSSDYSVTRLDLISGQFWQLFSLPEDTCCVTFSPNTQYMIVNRPSHGAGSKQLWDVERGELIKDLGRCDSDVQFAAFSPDSGSFAIGPCILDAQLWNTSTQQLLHNFPSRSPTDIFPEWRSAVFSPDGTQAAFGNDMGEVWIWDIDSGQLVNKLSIPLTTSLPTK